MRKNYNEALLYETLFQVLRRNEAEAWKMYDNLRKCIDVSRPLPEIISPLCDITNLSSVALGEAYYHLRTLFEAYEQRLSYEIIDDRDPLWPKGADRGESPVHFLFLAGNSALLSRPRVTVIGMKNPTQLGFNSSLIALGEINSAKCVMMSVFESGVDQYCIQNALLEKIPQIIVLSSPLHQCNPDSFRELMVAVVNSGSLLITSFPPSARSEKWFSIPRNRLLMAISEYVVIPEERDGGPSWALADIAHANGAPVILFESSVQNPAYKYATAYAQNENVIVWRKKNDLKRVLVPMKSVPRKKKENPDQLELF